MQLFRFKSLDQVCVYFGLSFGTTLIILNEEMDYIMKIVKSLEESGLLIKGVSQTIKYEAKERKGEFLGMLLGTLENLL